MRIGIPRETRDGETRVAATPETVKKYVNGGHTVLVEHGAGLAARMTDQAYADAGAQLADSATAFGADLVLKVLAPREDELALMQQSAVLVGMPHLASLRLRWRPRHVSPVHRAWMFCHLRLTSRATRRCCSVHTTTAACFR